MKNFFKKLVINLLIIALGAGFTLAFAPFYYFALGFVVLPCFFYFLLKSKSKKQAFFRGWLFGMGHHVTGLYWVANSLLVEADKFAWLVPFAVLLLPAYLAIFIGAAASFAYSSRLKFYSKIVYFAGVWVFAEVIRSYLFTGFPWNLAGMVFMVKPELASTASIIGVYGLSFLAILFFTTPYLLYENLINAKAGNPARLGVSLTYFAPILSFLIFSGVWGQGRFSDEVTATKVRIVQPSISQIEKFAPEYKLLNIKKYEGLSNASSQVEGFGSPDLIIWPEAALPVYFATDKTAAPYLQQLIKPAQNLLLGTVRLENVAQEQISGQNYKIYNSMQIISGKNGLLPQAYDKVNLVPFGEYIPLREFFPNVDKITYGMGDFNKGQGNVVIKLPEEKTSSATTTPPFITLICYEIVYTERTSGIELQNLATKPEWILNITNDAWFGDSTGPRQHLDIVRMRAIESGLPIIRAANNGISAVIDAYGRIQHKLEYNKVGIIDANLPKPAKEFASDKNGKFGTYYAKHGLKQTLVIIFIILAFIILRDRRKR